MSSTITIPQKLRARDKDTGAWITYPQPQAKESYAFHMRINSLWVHVLTTEHMLELYDAALPTKAYWLKALWRIVCVRTGRVLRGNEIPTSHYEMDTQQWEEIRLHS